MSTRGQFNTKNPTIKRILKEASELANNASADYHAEPLEDNLFEWHFTLRGPPAPSPYANGIYHGRIILPPTYPLRPPSFRFLTPTGRFEVNREICLSISGHHEETWQPAWGIRTAMVAIRSFMDTDAKGQLGGLECTEDARKSMAGESGRFKCATCCKTNHEILQEREQAAGPDAGKQKEETVPEELRLAYREDLQVEGRVTGSRDKPTGSQETGTTVISSSSIESNARNEPITTSSRSTHNHASDRPRSSSSPSTSLTASAARPSTQSLDHGVPGWLDKAIWGLVALLVFMVARKILHF